MKNAFCIFLLFSLLNASETNCSWHQFDFQAVKKAPKIQEENLDFQKALNSLLSNTLENENGIDTTDGVLDFQNENIRVKNLSSIYEGENDSLLFQKELFIAQDGYNYSSGLINRYKKDNFLFGFNGFVDKQEEQKNAKSFGAEFGYGDFVKAYSNYYVLDEINKSFQLGISFIDPAYNKFTFDVIKDEEKTNYQLIYSPYSILNLNISRRIFNANTNENDIAVQIGFNFSFDKSFSRQLHKQDNIFQEINRYDFLERIY
ncbi:inverse autotransporter beta domain-containing protein [Campylobacter sp. B0100352/1]|uniref:inverse autotransporter beta domain-containing protein n=1 Tax=unclassified Campylobacter TaxID=2593542 RepID=UPI001E18BA74|nr:inverse autotransporter beta domain-containing protein [Campylobacter sp. B0100352/1]MBZ7963658.1 inverse autotransporter beta domain-containing protein [Campylobacter sp. 2457A]